MKMKIRKMIKSKSKIKIKIRRPHDTWSVPTTAPYE
jgi:hypothetical protein